MVKKYGLIMNNMVVSVFYSDGVPADYPDIEHLLEEIPEEVDCNYVKTGEDEYYLPVEE